MKLTRINHIQISIEPGGEELVRKFYGGLLGLEEVEKPETLKSRGGLWMAMGEQSVHFGAEAVADRWRSKRHVAFEVEDLPSVCEELRAAGVLYEAGLPIPGYERIEFRDPFGNRLELMERHG